MESVISLEQTAGNLQDKQDRLYEREQTLLTELEELSVPAHVDNDKSAQTRIGKISAELSAVKTEMTTVIRAINVVNGRIAVARKSEDIKVTRQQARDALGHFRQFEAAGRKFDECMQAAMRAYAEMEQHHRSYNLLGFNTPDRARFRIMSERVLKGHLDALPMFIKNDLKLTTAPRERVTFGEVFDGYHDYVQGRQDGWNLQVDSQMSRILGEEFEKKEAA